MAKSCIGLNGEAVRGEEYFFGIKATCVQMLNGLVVICWCRSVEYEGALQFSTKCNLVKACIVVTEGVRHFCLMEDACRKNVTGTERNLGAIAIIC